MSGYAKNRCATSACNLLQARVYDASPSILLPNGSLSRNRRHFRLGWKELHIEGLRLVFKPFEALETELDFVFGDSLFDVLAPVAQHSIHQTGKMVSHGNNGFGSAQAAFEAAVLCPERCLAVGQTLRAQSQRIGS